MGNMRISPSGGFVNSRTPIDFYSWINNMVKRLFLLLPALLLCVSSVTAQETAKADEVAKQSLKIMLSEDGKVDGSVVFVAKDTETKPAIAAKAKVTLTAKGKVVDRSQQTSKETSRSPTLSLVLTACWLLQVRRSDLNQSLSSHL